MALAFMLEAINSPVISRKLEPHWQTLQLFSMIFSSGNQDKPNGSSTSELHFQTIWQLTALMQASVTKQMETEEMLSFIPARGRLKR